jgi:parvulin-like peptidyl-prolyl isomerase
MFSAGRETAMRAAIFMGSALMCLGLLAGFARAQTAPRPAAIVDGAAITEAEVDVLIKSMPPTATPLTEAQRRQIRRDVLETLINDMLFQQMMRRIGRRIDVAEVEQQLSEAREALKKQGKTLQDLFKEAGKSEAQIRSEIVTSLQWISYVHEHFPEPDLKKYFDENRDFFDRTSVRASHIVMRLSPNPGDAERQSLRAKLEAVRQDLLAAKIDFTAAAKKYSQDGSAANGGDIGYFPRKMFADENYSRAAFAMKVGEISPVVETESGFYLIKVTDRKPGKPADFNQVKDAVKELCVTEAQMTMITQYRKSVKVEINLPL